MILVFFLLESLSAETRYRVKSSDNVNSIVEKFYKNSDLSKGQIFVGILAKNPRAFKGGNINFLLSGKRLTLPNERELRDISPEKAKEVLSEHANLFRRGKTGRLTPLKLSELTVESTTSVESITLLEKQELQSKKIEQLQRESTALQKQLENLMSQKNNREKRLLELEESLKETQNKVNADALVVSKFDQTNKSIRVMEDSAPKSMAKSETIKTTKVEDPIIKSKKPVVRTIESTDSFLPYLIWLIPLVLLLGILIFILIKSKRKTAQADEFIEVGDSGYIENFDDEMPMEEIHTEEEPLETSVKLDVARAYIEAEDVISAREILSEIMIEGNDDQKQTAQELLRNL